MTATERLDLLNKVILAVRPHGMLAESVLAPLQTLRDDMAAETASVAPQPVSAAPSPVQPKPVSPPVTAPQPAPVVPASISSVPAK